MQTDFLSTFYTLTCSRGPIKLLFMELDLIRQSTGPGHPEAANPTSSVGSEDCISTRLGRVEDLLQMLCAAAKPGPKQEAKAVSIHKFAAAIPTEEAVAAEADARKDDATTAPANAASTESAASLAVKGSFRRPVSRKAAQAQIAEGSEGPGRTQTRRRGTQKQTSSQRSDVLEGNGQTSFDEIGLKAEIVPSHTSCAEANIKSSTVNAAEKDLQSLLAAQARRMRSSTLSPGSLPAGTVAVAINSVQLSSAAGDTLREKASIRKEQPLEKGSTMRSAGQTSTLKETRRTDLTSQPHDSLLLSGSRPWGDRVMTGQRSAARSSTAATWQNWHQSFQEHWRAVVRQHDGGNMSFPSTERSFSRSTQRLGVTSDHSLARIDAGSTTRQPRADFSSSAQQIAAASIERSYLQRTALWTQVRLSYCSTFSINDTRKSI